MILMLFVIPNKIKKCGINKKNINQPHSVQSTGRRGYGFRIGLDGLMEIRRL